MLSWDALDPFRLMPAGVVTAAFLGIAKIDLRTAAQYTCELPYGRNSDPNDPLIVLVEKRGTCSTKHALLRRLASEQKLDIALVLGIYEMTEGNTPGVGPILQRHGLSHLPEAHCYLWTEGKHIDLTRAPSARLVEPIARLLHEEEISPEQITHYKTAVHRRFLMKWMANNAGLSGLTLETVWEIREECIARLSQ
ncbi:MAG: hypothetical protein JO061_07295 [Acidobacteriaceae bacterium]|nr:hypothetical protein [Acidobacteriaceae bacterium]